MDSLEEVFSADVDAAHRRFAAHAPALATEASRGALREAGLDVLQVDALIVSTCTGYLCPGLTSYVSESLGLRADCRLLDLVGQGCGAAIPNLHTAHDLLRGQGAQHVLSVCVEICSAAYYVDDDEGVLISNCLFGDGAAAVVSGRKPIDVPVKVEWLQAATQLCPQHRELLRFEQKNGRLRNILTPEVPPLAATEAAKVLECVLKKTDIDRGMLSRWLFHAGGRNVLAELSRVFKLDADDLSLSRELLRTHGNMSSPFVLFLLERAMQSRPQAGYWWLASFGAGFSSHGALLHVG
jgi:alkylresorcinol/alkylpyrone synthase